MPNQAKQIIRLACPSALAVGGLSVDREAGVIRNISIIAAGPAIGHGFEVDGVMLQQVVASINGTGTKGVKSRLTHPTPDLTGQPRRDPIETALGRVRNARVDGNQVRGDLHIANYAAKSPSGDLRDFVLSIAEEDPEAAGLSIVFQQAEFEKVDGRRAGRVKSIVAVDIVGDPGANPGGMLSEHHCPDCERRAAFRKENPQAIDRIANAITKLASQRGDTMPENTNTNTGNDNTTTTMSADDTAREIIALAQIGGLGNDWAIEQITKGATVDQVKQAALAARKQNQQAFSGTNPADITGGRDSNLDTLRLAIVDAMSIKLGAKLDKPHERAREFQGLGYGEMARSYLGHLGVSTVGLGRAGIAKLAWKRHELERVTSLAQSTGDFSHILGDAMNKTARIGYMIAPRTWDRWARRATAPDFKTVNRVTTSDLPKPIAMSEGAEYKYKTISDTGESYVLVKYGVGLKFTWQALVNDDLGELERLLMRFANVARVVEDDVAYYPITSNQEMAEDETALFHTDHANLSSSSDAIAVASLGAGRSGIALQTGPKGNFLNLQARHLLVPVEKQTLAEQVTASLVDPAANNNTDNPAWIRGLNVVGEPRLSANSGTAWHLAADSNQIDTVEVCFLEDEPEPVVEQKMDFDTDDLKIKLRHTVAGRAIDYRGFWKNPGA